MSRPPFRPGPVSRTVGLIAIVAVLSAGCTSAATRRADRLSAASARAAATGASTSSASASTPAIITIKNFKFGPDPLTVKAGAAIQVTNADDTAHTVTADAGANEMFDTHDLVGGAKGSITIHAPGTYRYHCDIHNYMTGVIQVRA